MKLKNFNLKNIDFSKMIPPENVSMQMSWIDEMSNPNQFFYWYERILQSGMNIPKSKYYILSYDECKKFISYFYQEEYNETIESHRNDFYKLINEKLIKPFIHDYNYSENDIIFMKNGTFSNKFNFETCHIGLKKIHNQNIFIDKFENLTFESLMHETGGHFVFVLREFIKPILEFGTIYNGMPLRPEFRVFYDFDLKNVLYTVNYWDYDYCSPYIYDDKDKKVFNEAKNNLNMYFNKYKESIENKVKKHMDNLSNNVMHGVWSIDLLLNSDDIDNDLWLIDMAVGSRSAYYDNELINKRQKEIEEKIKEKK